MINSIGRMGSGQRSPVIKTKEGSKFPSIPPQHQKCFLFFGRVYSKPLGFLEIKFQLLWHISSMVRVASQPSNSFALEASA